MFANLGRDAQNIDPTTTQKHEIFLLRLRYKEGRLQKVGGNTPMLLDSVDYMWVVFAGKIDLFAVPLADGAAAGNRTYLTQFTPGEAIFGMSLAESGVGLLVVPHPDTQLVRIQQSRFFELIQEGELFSELVGLLNNWVDHLYGSLVHDLPGRNIKRLIKLVRDEEIILHKNQGALPKTEIKWIKPLSGALQFLGRENLLLTANDLFTPLSKEVWVYTPRIIWMEVISTERLLRQNDGMMPHLEQFHQIILQLTQAKISQTAETQMAQLAVKKTAGQTMMNQALMRLVDVLEPQQGKIWLTVEPQTEPLFAACSLIGNSMGISMRQPIQATLQSSEKHGERLQAILRVSGVRARQVALRGRWWRTDGEPLLGFLGPPNLEQAVEENQHSQSSNTAVAGGQPVALLPHHDGDKNYRLVNPLTQTEQQVDESVAATLGMFAYTFYRPLPIQPLRATDLLRFGAAGLRNDWLMVVLTGLGGGLLSLIIPLFTELLFDSIIPEADVGQLLPMFIFLLVVAIALSLFHLTRSFALLRIRTKMDATLHAALWDRLLRLPVGFFRQYTAGDLTTRADGINTIKYIISGPTITAILGGLFASLNLLLMFYYEWRLAALGLGLVLFAVLVTGAIGLLKLRYQRQKLDVEGQLSGVMFQFIRGITKFRVAGMERWAFALWAKTFTEQRRWTFKGELMANLLVTFNASYSVAAMMLIFGGMIWLSNEGQLLSTGEFLAFNTAFGQLLLAVLTLTLTLVDVQEAVPVYERLRPILQTTPELAAGQLDPGELRGEIELNNVMFAYEPDSPMIFAGLSLRIEPREFVAVVGPSGAGKSTLLRLLLGFEKPESGSIYFDGQDLQTLDVEAVRRQIGTVLQHGRLMTGDLFSNIVGPHALTMADAWEAARQVGLAADIEQLPMGMHTVINDDGGLLSGGQQQRLMIARAIVHKPRILLFDEATSSLDNQTQAQVSKSLENLNATRLVIAHRLSTIINADRIIVIDQGRVVQQGTYKSLINQPGLFTNLAKRQLA